MFSLVDSNSGITFCDCASTKIESEININVTRVGKTTCDIRRVIFDPMATSVILFSPFKAYHYKHLIRIKGILNSNAVILSDITK